MINAVKQPAKILLLGGTSDIGIAITCELLKNNPAEVVLAARLDSPRLAAAEVTLITAGAKAIHKVDFEATNYAKHVDTIDAAFQGADVDIAIIAFGILPDAEAAWHDHTVAVQTASINYTAAVSVGSLIAQKFLFQGHGQFIALSSVAGELIRKSNFAYGASKAGFDGFYRGLGATLAPQGIKTLVVRPGQVRTAMTHGMKDAPLTVNAEVVAQQVIKAYWSGKSLIWTPVAFKPILSLLRHIPTKILYKLPI